MVVAHLGGPSVEAVDLSRGEAGGNRSGWRTEFRCRQRMPTRLGQGRRWHIWAGARVEVTDLDGGQSL